jgi:hypothetical protein
MLLNQVSGDFNNDSSPDKVYVYYDKDADRRSEAFFAGIDARISFG